MQKGETEITFSYKLLKTTYLRLGKGHLLSSPRISLNSHFISYSFSIFDIKITILGGNEQQRKWFEGKLLEIYIRVPIFQAILLFRPHSMG